MELRNLLVLLVERKANVLHLVAGSPPLAKVRGGPLTLLLTDPLSVSDIKEMLEKTLSPSQKEKLEKERELNTAYSVEGVGRFRLSIFFQRGTLAGILRLIPPTPPSIEELGLPSILKDAISKPQGLILIAGPKGSGKSQTLAAVLDFLLNTKPVQIVSLEDPIEFLLKNKKGIIYQREVGTDVASFKQGLVTALRQNPDVIALTDLPDHETIGGVLSAASTGQLVIATINANGVVMALEQMIELAPQHFQQTWKSQLAVSLELALGQLLLNKKSGGLVLASEILIGNSQSKSLIREGKFSQLVACMNNNRDIGMISQEIAIRTLMKKNLVELEEAIGKAARPEELRRLAALPI
jgi:twitching motility protein PilT